MIKKIKIVSILVSLSLMISIFFGCTAEEQVIKEHSHSQDTKLTKVPLSELMLQAKFSTAYKKIPKKKVVKYDIAGRSVLEDQFGFTILDAPVNVIEKDGQTYYNILIVSDNNTDNKIENLIISSLTNQDNEFYQVKYKATNTTVNALDVIEQGVEDIINLETQNSTDTNRCSFYEVTSYYCTAAGTAQDCEGSDTQSGCHGTTTMTMSCSGGSGFNYGNPSGNGSTSSNGGSNGGSNGTVIGSPVTYNYTSINLTTALNLNTTQQQFIDNPNNFRLKKDLQVYVFSNQLLFFGNNGLAMVEFLKQLIDLAIANPTITWSQIQKWFLSETDGPDDNYDAAFWDNPNLSFPPQNLPSRLAFKNGIPANPDGTTMTGADNIYGLVGGPVLQVRTNDGSDGKERTRNTCALKMSIALNRSGVVIPNIPGHTVEGGGFEFAGKYFFLNAKKLNIWMRETFGTSPATATTPFNANHISIPITAGGVNGINFPTLPALQGISGIYSVVFANNDASGHADYIYTNASGQVDCANNCFFNLSMIRMDVWKLD